jgi:hypothetical protein
MAKEKKLKKSAGSGKRRSARERKLKRSDGSGKKRSVKKGEEQYVSSAVIKP